MATKSKCIFPAMVTLIILSLIAISSASRSISGIACPKCVCCGPQPLGGGCCGCCSVPVEPEPVLVRPPSKGPIYCPECVCCGPKPINGCCKCCTSPSIGSP
ncbi:hypothetical protein QJS10_CPB17g01719 [Acorus calamus]|uniref:Uncharacterized protein n=1 Tax=Acorus calamus TaxID=4465 RepID=A0AAV9CY87_ACOCL|nr:hypothetical protein QJS10_CPB17g01719 [Acorus calamus]